MGILGDAGSALNAASSLLGGPQTPAAAPPPDTKPTYLRDVSIGDLPPDAGGAVAPQDLASFNKGAPTELIHFDWVHPDDSLYFDGNVSQDTVDLKLTSAGKHAAMFRAALEREAILLWGFADSCMTVLKQKEAGAGATGQLMSAVSSLLGTSGGSSGPKSSDLNPFTSAALAAGGQINVSAVTYTLTHKTGMDLTQARANYRAYLVKTCNNPAGDKPSSSITSALGSAGSALSGVASAVGGALPGIGDIFSVIQGIVFKAFDIYVAMFLKVAVAQERAIETACHALTINAIQKNYSPIFPAWFPPPTSAGSSSSSSGGSDPVSKAMQGVSNAQKDVKDFLDGPDGSSAPGAPFLAQAFSLTPPPGTPKDQPPPLPSTITDMVIGGFRQALDPSTPEGKTLPSFLQTLMTTICQYDLDFLQAIYSKLLVSDPNTPIDKNALYQAASKRLLQRLVDLLLSKVQFLQSILAASASVGGQSISPGQFLGRGEDALNKELTKAMAPILAQAMSDVGDQLEGSRKTAAAQKCMTMEVYLGRLPWLEVLLFRDTFFPIWDLLVKLVFGKIGGPISSLMNSSSAFFKTAKGGIDDVRQDVQRAQKVADRAENQGLNAGTSGQNLSGYKDDLNSMLAPDSSSSAPATASSTFPISGRQLAANGTKIVLSEWNTVKAKHQWETAVP
jgi:hypothetical protein